MQDYTLQELQVLILKWAEDKNLIKPENASKQKLKLLEEVGETAKATLKNDVPEQTDGIGDVFIVLVILAAQEGEDYNFNIESGYDEYSLDQCLGSIIYYEYVLGHTFLNLLATHLNLDLIGCCNAAWNEIKNRTGQTIDGTFIKD